MGKKKYKSIFDLNRGLMTQDNRKYYEEFLLNSRKILSITLSVKGTSLSRPQCDYFIPVDDDLAGNYTEISITYFIPFSQVFNELLELSVFAIQLEKKKFIFFLNDWPDLNKKVCIDYLSNVNIVKYRIDYSNYDISFLPIFSRTFTISDDFKILKCSPDHIYYLTPYNKYIKSMSEQVKKLKRTISKVPNDIKLLMEIENQ